MREKKPEKDFRRTNAANSSNFKTSTPSNDPPNTSARFALGDEAIPFRLVTKAQARTDEPIRNSAGQAGRPGDPDPFQSRLDSRRDQKLELGTGYIK